MEGGGTVPPLPRLREIEGTRVATAGDPMTAKAADFAVWPMRTQPGDQGEHSMMVETKVVRREGPPTLPRAPIKVWAPSWWARKRSIVEA